MQTFLKNPTIKEVLEKYPVQLEPTFGPPKNDIELLLQEVLSCDKYFLYAHPEKRLATHQFTRFKSMLAKRKKQIPLQYIFGKGYFYGHTFKVNKHVLIPRPETELLVDKVIEYIPHHNIRNIVDIGTGSGAVIISIALALQPSKKNYHYIATDTSNKAIYTARYNALRHKIDINVRKRDLLNRPNTFIPLTSWVLVSNPPYVETKDLDEPSIQYEPKQALDGGSDGLDYYDKILWQVSLLQNKPKAIFFEIGYNQAESIKLLTQKYLEEYTSYEVFKDYAGLDRIVKITL